jgi:hypothetical protein
MQPVATPSALIDALRRELEEMARAEVARFNEGRATEGHEPAVEYVIHPAERVRLISHTHPTTLLIEVAADDLAINVVLASGHEAHAGYPKQVPLVVVLKDGVAVLETQGGGPSPSQVLADEFRAFFRLLEN